GGARPTSPVDQRAAGTGGRCRTRGQRENQRDAGGRCAGARGSRAASGGPLRARTARGRPGATRRRTTGGGPTKERREPKFWVAGRDRVSRAVAVRQSHAGRSVRLRQGHAAGSK